MTPTLTHRAALALALASIRALLREAASMSPTTTNLAAAIDGARHADRECGRALAEILPTEELPKLGPASLSLAKYVGIYGGGSIQAGEYYRDYAMRRYGTECRQTSGSLSGLAHLVIQAAHDLTAAEAEFDALLAGQDNTEGDMGAAADAARALRRRVQDARTRLMGASIAMQLAESAAATADAATEAAA